MPSRAQGEDKMVKKNPQKLDLFLTDFKNVVKDCFLQHKIEAKLENQKFFYIEIETPCKVIGLPERTQDDTTVFTIFIGYWHDSSSYNY